MATGEDEEKENCVEGTRECGDNANEIKSQSSR